MKVVSMRVSQEFYDLLKKQAEAHGRTMGQELLWRAREGYRISDEAALRAEVHQPDA